MQKILEGANGVAVIVINYFIFTHPVRQSSSPSLCVETPPHLGPFRSPSPQEEQSNSFQTPSVPQAPHAYSLASPPRDPRG